MSNQFLHFCGNLKKKYQNLKIRYIKQFFFLNDDVATALQKHTPNACYV
jgi:hypothetical protein